MRISIPRDIIEQTLSFFRKYGSNKQISAVIWIGNIKDKNFHVSDVLFPEQKNTITYYKISNETRLNMLQEINSMKKQAIAQVSSKPNYAFFAHHDDIEHILEYQGSYSVIVPDFGHIYDISKWEIFELIGLNQGEQSNKHSKHKWKKVEEELLEIN